MTPVRLTRPALASMDAQLDWPGRVVAVFGPGDLEFARSIASVTPAVLVRPELRHTPGHRRDGERIYAHPDALLPALSRARPDPTSGAIVIGVGPVFAIAVRADPVIWITGGQPPSSLHPALRDAARRADLALERARLPLAEELAKRLAT